LQKGLQEDAFGSSQQVVLAEAILATNQKLTADFKLGAIENSPRITPALSMVMNGFQLQKPDPQHWRRPLVGCWT